jgi:hypothetical protein
MEMKPDSTNKSEVKWLHSIDSGYLPGTQELNISIARIYFTMGFGVQHYIIATRFIVTMGHLTSLLLLFSTIQNNVNLSFDDEASSSETSTAYNTCIVSNCVLSFPK